MRDISDATNLKSESSQIFFNFYSEEFTNRSITNLRSVHLLSESQKEWWVGLPKELQNDIELEE